MVVPHDGTQVIGGRRPVKCAHAPSTVVDHLASCLPPLDAAVLKLDPAEFIRYLLLRSQPRASQKASFREASFPGEI
jgi:hypothetical protein